MSDAQVDAGSRRDCSGREPGKARVNPLKTLAEQKVRPEVILVLDLSQSMLYSPADTSMWGSGIGQDCDGTNATNIDYCGDGICTNRETSACLDCNITNNNTSTAGMALACNTASAYSTQASRLYIARRVLRNVLPNLRTVGSFGLVTFTQTGYFPYYLASAACNPATATGGKRVTVFFAQYQLTQMGGWNTGSSTPQSFTWNSTPYSILSAANYLEGQPNTLTCNATTPCALDSLYKRSDNPGIEKRFAYAGGSLSQGGFTWNYVGSYFSYYQCALAQAPGSPGTTGLTTSTTYLGPQYGAGPRYVYYRAPWLSFGWGSTTYDVFSGPSSGAVVENLSYSQTQASQDAVIFRIMNRMSSSTNGGLLALNYTPSGPAIATAHQHYLDRKNGTGPFSALGVDSAASCRKRYVVFITDGQSNTGNSPQYEAAQLFNDAAFVGNEVKTFSVGIPGVPSAAQTELDLIADAGDDGCYAGQGCDMGACCLTVPRPAGCKCENSASAYMATNEQQLVDAINEILFDALKGDYATAAGGSVTSTDQAVVANNVSIQATTEYPTWNGRVRAVDFSKACTSDSDCTALVPGTTCAGNGYCLLWEAGAKLDTRIAAGAADPRYVYSGKRGVNSHLPCRAWNASGIPCWGTSQTNPGPDATYGTADDTSTTLPS
ncbi:MAG: hypothetical protein ACOY3Y_08865, partial [Acidobacteriota bacterium]